MLREVIKQLLSKSNEIEGLILELKEERTLVNRKIRTLQSLDKKVSKPIRVPEEVVPFSDNEIVKD